MCDWDGDKFYNRIADFSKKGTALIRNMLNKKKDDDAAFEWLAPLKKDDTSVVSTKSCPAS